MLKSVSRAVRNVIPETPDNTTLVLTWRPPNTINGDLLYYIVRITFHENNTVIVDDIVMTELMSFTADNLSKIQLYSVTMIDSYNSLL